MFGFVFVIPATFQGELNPSRFMNCQNIILMPEDSQGVFFCGAIAIFKMNDNIPVSYTHLTLPTKRIV